MSAKKVKPLSDGPHIFAIAPGMPFDVKELELSLKMISSWGCPVLIPRDLLNKKHPVCASDRATRWGHLKAALLDPRPGVIWAVRGGYGSLHLIPELEKIKKPTTPKLLVGFSDVTTLHLFFNQKWGWETWHGPHLDRVTKLSQARQNQLRQSLLGHKKQWEFSNLRALNSAAQKTRSLEGTLRGGNLVTLQASLGTATPLKGAGALLYFEDIGERGYRIDRVLEHLQQAGVFQKVRGVIFGPFVGGEELSGRDLTQKVIREFAARQPFAVFTGVASGHIPNSQVLPLGVWGHIRATNKGWTLSITTGWSP